MCYSTIKVSKTALIRNAVLNGIFNFISHICLYLKPSCYATSTMDIILRRIDHYSFIFFFLLLFPFINFIDHMLLIFLIISTSWKVSKYRVFPGPYFFCICNKYRDLLRNSPYSVQIQENADQKKLRFRRFSCSGAHGNILWASRSQKC